MGGRHVAPGAQERRRRGPRAHRSPRRPVARTALVAAALVLAVGLTGWGAAALLGPAEPPAVRSALLATDADGGAGAQGGAARTDLESTAGAPSAVRGVQALLDQRAAALLSRDRDGWLAAVVPDGAVQDAARPALTSYRLRTAEVFDRLAPVPLGSWTWEVDGGGPALSAERAQQLPAGSWVVRTTLQWSVQGADDAPVRRQQDLTAVPSGAGWALVDDADGETVRDLWDLGAVGVVSTDRAVVVGTASAEALDAAAQVAVPSAEAVDAVWGTGWPRRTVVEVPADQAQMAALLGRTDESGLERIAAVTTGELVGADGATTGDHVVVNPAGFGRLAPLGQRVVLTHELTHVATRYGAVRAAPLWLSEGFADWVGYQGSGLQRGEVAADLLTRTAREGLPADLPTPEEFDPTATQRIGEAYSGAWLAVDALDRRYGGEAVVRLYRAVTREQGPSDPDAALDAALARVLDTDRPGVVVLWRAELQELSR